MSVCWGLHPELLGGSDAVIFGTHLYCLKEGSRLVFQKRVLFNFFLGGGKRKSTRLPFRVKIECANIL